ncbi:hypothetical protein QP916_02670 [Corynebacterium accolens]|jgi:hypothetical protein|uniref:hypothetical protein n=1 Tax=Corynebacterium accolens TaxID=38284 RepID=UPI00205FB0E1|nr:hypothetical protein [Corynebacterium accolens]MDK8497569.1 hypothetical protein [Corynebacterium accolens]DAX93941.1 MAG TPA: Major head protein [Caudoviricetes sp.]
MAEETTATNDEQNAAEVAEAQPTQEEGDAKSERSAESYQQEIEKVRKESARYRTERNELRADAEKYREIQEAEKTELQRAQEALEAERTKAHQFQVELARSKALSKYGISEENADLLGADPDKFDDNAKRLGELQAQAAKRAAPPTDYPVEDMKPGASSKEDTPDYSFPAGWPVNGKFA